MTDFGKSLREAREAKDLSVGQLAEMTKILPAVIEGLENDDFTRIAAPIYGRGFVKLYCEAIGLDPKPFIAEFMEIVNGNRETVIRERKLDESVTPTPPAPQPEPQPIEAEPAVQEPVEPEPDDEPQEDLFSEPPVFDSSELVRQKAPVLPFQPTAAEATVEEDPVPQQTITRYASPFRLKNRPALPPALWRLCMLAFAGLIVLALLFWGLRALYRATTSTDEAPVDAIAQAETAIRQNNETDRAEREPESPAPAPRSPQKVPDLYID